MPPNEDEKNQDEDDEEVVVKVNFIYNIKKLQTDINNLMEKQKNLSKWEVKYPPAKFPEKAKELEVLKTEIELIHKNIEIVQ